MKCHPILIPYTLLIVCMGVATLIERLYGAELASRCVYGAYWFVAVWALLAVWGVVMLFQKKLHKKHMLFTLHLALAGILLGAALTFFTAQHGTISLRLNQPNQQFILNQDRSEQLPFTLCLSKLDIRYYPGTDAPEDYICTLVSSETDQPYEVSMNHIASIRGYRFCLQHFDSDLQGCTLRVSHDPYGIPVTYISYLLLLISILGSCFMRMRHHHVAQSQQTAHSASAEPTASKLSAPAKKAEATIMLLFFCLQVFANQPHGVDAPEMNQVAVLYNGRICPLNTPANDFLTKLAGKPSWNGFSADQVFLGWMIYYDEWERQPIIRIKSKEVQKILGIDTKWASLRDFYTDDNQYKLQNHLLDNPTDKQLREADEKVRLISMFYAGEFTKIFPYKGAWYSPGSDALPTDIEPKEFLFIKHSMDQFVRAVLSNDDTRRKEIVGKIKCYQSAHASLPSTLLIEQVYNTLQAQRWIVYVFLLLTLLMACADVFTAEESRPMKVFSRVVAIALWLFITLLLVLRWIVSRHVPLSSGFETMLFLSWAVSTLSIMQTHRLPLLAVAGPLVASFALLVATIASGSPKVTPLMPVLDSPLLTLHVLCVMLAYAFFALLTLHAFAVVIGKKEMPINVHKSFIHDWNRWGVFLLTIGIFLGAVWANVSWGRYWGWDPKETWALITLLIYSLPLHPSLIQLRGKALCWYLIIAFLAVIMTYWGVNFLLPGMHSYA